MAAVRAMVMIASCAEIACWGAMEIGFSAPWAMILPPGPCPNSR